MKCGVPYSDKMLEFSKIIVKIRKKKICIEKKHRLDVLKNKGMYSGDIYNPIEVIFGDLVTYIGCNLGVPYRVGYVFYFEEMSCFFVQS